MSLIPAFEIGVWNAWILMFYPALSQHPILMRLIAGKDGLERMRNATDMPLSKTQKKISNFSTAIFILLLIYSIFLPLKLGAIWFYVGLPICLLGLIMLTIALANVANIPLDQPFTKGMYRYSRHPMYVTWFLALIGIGIASASWTFLLLSIMHTTPSFVHAISEERFCLKKYGAAYREYMNKTPRWIGIPKSVKSEP